MHLVVKTFLGILLLRKGPEDIPKSALLLAMSVAMMAASELLLYALVEMHFGGNMMLDFATEIVKIGAYVAVLFVFGFMGRVAQTMTAIIGCSAMMVFLFVAVFVLCKPFLGQDIAGALAWGATPWLVLVEGHIIARSIQRHWFTGIAIAVVIFTLQFSFYLTLSQTPNVAVS